VPEPPGADPAATDPAEGQPGWAAPGLPAREPAGGDVPPPEAPPPDAPPPDATAPAPAAPPPSAAWQAPPAPPAPPAPGAPGPPASVRRSRAWLWILAVVLGVTVVAGAAGTVLFVDRSLPPFDAASDWVQAMEHDHFNEAYDMLCSADKQLDDAEGFRSAFRSLFDSSRNATTSALTVDRDGDRATVEFTVNGSGTGDDRTFELPLREEGGDWHACPGDSLRS
jgi:uncharacterized membrane protein